MLVALEASLWAGATREPARAGPGATRGVGTALEAAPNTPREGFAAGEQIASGAPGAKHAQRPFRAWHHLRCPPALRPGLTGTRGGL